MSDAADLPAQASATEQPDPEYRKLFEEAILASAKATERGDTAAAEQAALKAFMLATQEAIEHPTPDLLLGERAGDYLEKGDWAGAESTYRELIVMQQQTGNFGLIAKAQLDLSKLFRLLRRVEEAWEYATAAAASARRANISNFTSTVLELQMACASDRGDTQAALTAAKEAVDILEPGRIFDSARIRAFITRAEAYVQVGDPVPAEADLQTSWQLITARESGATLPGPRLSLARWFEVRGKLEAFEGRLPQAALALAQAIQHRRELNDSSCSPGPFGYPALAQLLDLSAGVAEQLGNTADAAAARAEAQALRQKAHLADNPK